MKFIYLLFLLTTLIAVALSQQIEPPTDRKVKIRSIATGQFWADHGVGITLEKDGSDWIIRRRENGEFVISPFIGIFSLYVQSNGLDKQLTVTFHDAGYPLPQNALWQIKFRPWFSFSICHYRQLSIIIDCATAGDGKVIENIENKEGNNLDPHQLWEIIPVES